MATSRKRFYKEVAVTAGDGGFGIALDGRPLQTPGRTRLNVPTRALAEAIRDEWATQGDSLDTEALRLTRLANTAIDRVPVRRAEVVNEVAGYAATDLL